MKKSVFKSQRLWLFKAGTFTLLILWVLSAPLVWAKEGYYATEIIKETKYVDKYFEVYQDGTWLMNIYLGEQKIATVDHLGRINYLLTDHLDSVVSVSDQSGNVLETNDYEPFGRMSYSQGELQNYKFAGQEKDRENNLQYFQNRYYSPVLARFMSIDPLLVGDTEKVLSDPQQLNTYSYSRNNPLTYIDPQGLETKVFIEKDKKQSPWDLNSWYGHTFVGIDGLIYNWDYNAGRLHADNDDSYAGEDIDIVTWEDFSRRQENQDKDWQVYTFDTDKRQEREIRRFYLELAAQNGASQGEDRFLYSLFYNGVDAAVGALQRGGVLSQKFSAGKLVSTGPNLQKSLDFRYKVQERNQRPIWDYYKNLYPNRVLKYIMDRSVIQ